MFTAWLRFQNPRSDSDHPDQWADLSDLGGGRRSDHSDQLDDLGDLGPAPAFRSLRSAR